MKNFIVLVFLLITTKVYGGVWYYGTGEAVNLENQIGFQNEPNVKIIADTNDLIGSWFGNELSLDPSRTDGNLLKNGDFENGIVEYACTNATAAFVDTTLLIQNNFKMFQMTVSVIGGYCDFTVTTGAALEGLLFKMGAMFQTTLAGVEYCTLVNGSVDNCIPVTAKTPWSDPLFTQSQAGATSVGVRVRSTTATGVVNVDKLHLSMGGLPTGPTVSCNGDLDCENEFSAQVSNASPAVVSALGGGDWIEATCIRSSTNNHIATCDFSPEVNFTLSPNCTATPLYVSGAGAYVYDATATTTQVTVRTQEGTTTLKQEGFTLKCCYW